jgi:hypothetical protein
LKLTYFRDISFLQAIKALFNEMNVPVGYLLPLEEAQWSINNSQDNLSNSPTLNYNYYFTLTVGLGTIFSDDEYRMHYSRNE